MILQLVMATALSVGPNIGDVRLRGPVADRMDAVARNHVAKTDPCYLSYPFHSRTETMYFHSEFWGKYMHSAPFFWKYTGDAALKENIARGVADIISTQTPDGYIGYYSEENRLGSKTWDVWGCKYTMMGLLEWYDATGDKKALDAAARLCDYMIGWFDPKAGHEPLHETGWVAGLASCSVLEPVVRLYRRTKDPRHLAFAQYVFSECGVDDPTPSKEGSKGPDLIDAALKGVPVADRGPWSNGRDNRRKAYEMMSCYQGFLEYFEATGDKRCLEAAVHTVDDIITNEVNLAGSGAVREYWYHGRAKQHLPYTKNQETCVTTTWMRLCEKLLLLTGNPKYADELERSFYNAYLAALKADGSFFATYTPLGGYRFGGQNHCFMFTNCCNANGPRGFIAFLEAFLRAAADEVYLNFYNSAEAKIDVPALGKKIELDVYTIYPKDGDVKIWNRTKGSTPFALKLRIPAWSANTIVEVNGERVEDKAIRPGTYLELRRTWEEGDLVDIAFDMSVKMHLADHAVAFTAGPVLLARDNRFGDGDISEVVRYGIIDANYMTPWLRGTERERPPLKMDFKVERSPNDAFWMCWSTQMPLGCHVENPDGKRWTTVRFCDFASAGSSWNPMNWYRAWLPVEYMPWE